MRQQKSSLRVVAAAAAGTFTVCAIAACGQSPATESPVALPRPVTVVTLAEIDPAREETLTGTVAAWKEQEIGFQISGRIEAIQEPGVNIRGRTTDETGRLLTEGTVLARLETRRYELQKQSAAAQLETAVAEAKAAETELQEVIPQQIAVAEAQQKLAAAERDRTKQLFERKAASQSDLDEADARFATAVGRLASEKANKAVKAAQLESARARVREAEEQLRQAEKDLEDTQLISPFHGQIASVEQIAGSFVQAGQAALTVQMMDPVTVEVALSAERDRAIHYSDVVDVLLPDTEEPVPALVWLKDTVADPATRTFRLTLLVRNRQIELGVAADEATAALPRVREAMQLFSESSRRTAPWYVNYRWLHEDDEGWFVWRMQEQTANDRRMGSTPSGGRVTLEKVRVVPGERRIPFLQVATFRELTDIGDLHPEEDLIAGDFHSPAGELLDELPAEVRKADTADVVYVRQQWQLRPGDFVQVELQGNALERGLYVPLNAIISGGGKQAVFVAEADEQSGRVTVRRVPVRADEKSFRNTLRRIEPLTPDGLKPGDRIVLDGAWFLSEGDAVTITREVSP